MADDLIDILVRLRGGNLAAAEARKVGRAVDDIGDEAEDSADKVGGLNRRLAEMRVAGVSGTLSINNLSGRLKLLGGFAAVTAPAVIGLAGSLAQAAGGAALLGGAGLGTMLAGLSGVGIIASGAAKGITKIQAAILAQQIALKGFGRDSTQYESATKRLHGVVANFGGQPILRAVRTLQALGKSWGELTKSARGSVATSFAEGLAAASRILPTFAKVTNASASSLGLALQGIFTAFSGTEARGILQAFGDSFGRIIGPLGKGFTDLLFSILRLFRAALPYFEQTVGAFARWAHGLSVATSNGKGVDGLVASLVSNFRSWFGLIKAVGRVLLALFSSSSDSGQSLVDSLTGVLNKFADWINKARAAGSAAKFFAGWNEVLRGVLGGLWFGFKLVYAVAKPFVDLLIWAAPALKTLISLFIASRLALLLLRGAIILVNIAFRLTPLGWIVTGIQLVIVAVVLMYKKWAWFRHAVQAVWSGLQTAWGWLSNRITGALDRWTGRFRSFIDWVKRARTNVQQFADSINSSGVGKATGGVANALGFHTLRRALGLEHRAAGGPVAAGRPYVVGEHRPELFIPDRAGTIAPDVTRAGVRPGSGKPQKVHLVLTTAQGKSLAEWMVGEVLTSDARA